MRPLWHPSDISSALFCMDLHCSALLYIAVHYFALLYVALLCIASHCFALNCLALLCIAWHMLIGMPRWTCICLNICLIFLSQSRTGTASSDSLEMGGLGAYVGRLCCLAVQTPAFCFRRGCQVCLFGWASWTGCAGSPALSTHGHRAVCLDGC